MVRETRHLWVGNLPDNIREDRIREHFKRYGRVQNVKLLGRTENATIGVGSSGNSGICATVAFMDIKSASKAHNAEHVLDERTLTTEYYEPAAIPSAAGAPSAGSSPAGSGYSGSSSSVNSTPAPASVSRYHMTGGEDGTGNTCPLAASAAAPATWRGTNDSATTEYCRRGNTPAAYGRYQRNNSTAPYATSPSNVERTTPHQRWYASGERAAGATGGESTPSTPGGGTESGRRRRLSGSGSSRSESSSPEPSDTSRASTPAAQPPLPHHANHRAPHPNQHQWAAATGGRTLAICVRNLPTRSTDSSLKDGLYHEYKKHGKVMWVKVVGQNADRYAVVRFKKPSDVEKALEVSQDKLFFGCKISVAPHQSCDEDADSAKPYETDIDEYHPKATRTLFIGNLEKDVTQQQLRDKFKHFGRIIEIDIKKGSGGGAGYAFCQYASISSVVEAIRAMDGEYVGGSRVKLGFGKPVATTCVWVDGLTEHTEKQVLGAVSRCGAATSVCVDRAAGAALVHFEQAAAAGAAVRELRRVAATVSAAEPDHPRLCVDYASRECQEAFYEQLEKHGGTAALAGSERLVGDVSTRYLPSTRHESLRYENCGSRSRASSYGRGSSRTPRYTTVEHYDPTDYVADRRYRVYDEVGSSPQTEEPPYEDRLQSVVVSPHRARRHRRDSSPDDRKHSKERHPRVGGRRSRSGSRGVVSERHSGRRRHRRKRDGSGSRAGTPLRDEPDAPPVEPRRPPRERPPLPMSLPLPKFAVQLLRTVPQTPRPQPAPAPDSPPRPPSVSSSSTGSAPHSPSLEERIRSLDEKYEKWSGSRASADAPDRTRLRHRLLDIDINEVKPSEVVRSLLAKRSVFDEDSERLEGAVRPPSPTDSPRSRSSCSARSLRLPYSMHSANSPHLSLSHLGLTSQSPHLTISSTDPEVDASDRPADPRLNRPERTIKLEKLGKFNESDYKLESRIRPRTPSTDRSLLDSSDRLSPGTLRDPLDESKEDVIRRQQESSGNNETERKKSLHYNIKECRENIEFVSTDLKNKISTAFDASHSLKPNICEKIVSSLTVKKESFQDGKQSNEPIIFHSEEKSARDVMDMLIKSVEQSPDCLNFDSILEKPNILMVDKTAVVTGYHEILENKSTAGIDSEPKIVCQSKEDSEKNVEILITNHVSKNINDIESHQKDLNSISPLKTSKESFEFTPDIVKSCDKNGKERYSHNILDVLHNTKQEKENIHFDKSLEKEKYVNNIKQHISIDKKNDSEKQTENLKNEREKLRKERSEKDRNEYEKLKGRTEKVFDKIEKKSKEENCLDRYADKEDKIRTEKEEKTQKDKKDCRDVEKTSKHFEDKLARYDHHRKEKSEKDKRKESLDETRFKKEDKHRHERCKKENDMKRENKKDSECIKIRKSSRDETSREITRKDSTDSSASRTSHESTRLKDLENSDLKEDIKFKLKQTDLLGKLDNDKDFLSKSVDIIKCDNVIKIKNESRGDKELLEFHPKIKSENVDNNFKIKTDFIEKQRHYSLDSPGVDSKRKERLNSCSSLPSNIGHKRRISSQDSLDSIIDDHKKSKNDNKVSERRDSKDSKSSDRHKTAKFNKGHFAKIIEYKTKDDKKNQVKPPDDAFNDYKDGDTKEKHADRNKPVKINLRDENEKSKDEQQEGLHKDIDFLATLELRSSEEDERQKALRKEMKEKKRIQQLQQIQELQMQQDALQQAELMIKNKDEKKQKGDEKKKEAAREKRMSTDRKSREEKSESSKRKNRKQVQTSDSSDSDEPKKHSIFDIIDDGPTYISMYDKVKARSCKNMQKQEEEKRQEKIKAKFSQFKQCRAKKEEKKRSSWDEDSDSDQDKKKASKSSMINSSDEENILMNKRRDKSHYTNSDGDTKKSDEYFDVTSNEENLPNKLSRKNSRTRIMSDTSEDDMPKRCVSKSPIFLNEIKKEQLSDSDSMHMSKNEEIKESNERKVKKNSLLNLFGKSDGDDSKTNCSTDFDRDYKSAFTKSLSNEFSSENESIVSSRNITENRKKHKKKQKKHKFLYSDDESKGENRDMVSQDGDTKHKSIDKQRRHSNKKEKRKEKTRESIDTDDAREDKAKFRKDKKSPNNNCFDFVSEINSSNVKKDGKMEDIFGPLSDESDKEMRLHSKHKSDFSCREYDSNYCKNDIIESKLHNGEGKFKEKDENRRRKDKKRKERHLFKEDDNSLDVDAVSKAIEARLFAESITDEENHLKIELPEGPDNSDQNQTIYIDSHLISEFVKQEKMKKDCREKKKKKKRSKEDRLSRKEHHFYHHEKNDRSDNVTDDSISASPPKPMVLNIPLPKESPTRPEVDKDDDCKSLAESPSLPRLIDSPPTLNEADKSDNTKKCLNSSDNSNIVKIDEMTINIPETIIDIQAIPIPPTQENMAKPIDNVNEIPLPPDNVPQTSSEYKVDLFKQFTGDISEDAVRSICHLKSDMDKVAEKSPTEKNEMRTNKVEKKLDEKPRAVISQEETEDAVAALLGESFGGKVDNFANCYEEPEIVCGSQNEIANVNVETENIPEEDAEEMRQAVQNLNASEMEMKPDTPVSDNDLLLIDTDTEEVEESTQDAIERLPVNIIATNQALNVTSENTKSDVGNIVTSKPKTPLIQTALPDVSNKTTAKLSDDVKVQLDKRDNLQIITSAATPVITSWTLSNNKSKEPHVLNIQTNSIVNKDKNENKSTHITSNILQIKAPQSQSAPMSNSLRPTVTPPRAGAPYQVINQMIRSPVSNIQPPTIKIPEPHILYQKTQGIVISPRMSNDPRLLSPKTNPQGDKITSPRLTNMTILNTSPQNINSVGLASPNTIQQRSPGQVTVVRMQQPPLSPIQAVHIPHGTRAMVSPNMPNSVLVQAQNSPIHFNRLPVTPVLTSISKQITVNNIVQQTKNISGNLPLMHQQKVIATEPRKNDQNEGTKIPENIIENSKIILSPTNLQHCTNPTVMAQNRLISMQVTNLNSPSHVNNKVLINSINQINDKRESQPQKLEQLNPAPFCPTPIIHVAGVNQPTASIIQSGVKPVVCSTPETSSVSRGQGSNVIHTINSQRLLTSTSLGNAIQIESNKIPPPSVLSMAPISKSTSVLTKVETSNAAVIATNHISAVSQLLLTSTNEVSRYNTKDKKEPRQDIVSLQNHTPRGKDFKSDTDDKTDTIVKQNPTESVKSPAENISKEETDFEELLKDKTNEIKITNNPEKKLEVNVGKTVTLFTTKTSNYETSKSIDYSKKDNDLENTCDLTISEESSSQQSRFDDKEDKNILNCETLKLTSEDNVGANTEIKSEEDNISEKDIVLENADDKIHVLEEENTQEIVKLNKIDDGKVLAVTADYSEPSDNKIKCIEENDSWNAKDLNIESVIKKVDSLCNETTEISNIKSDNEVKSIASNTTSSLVIDSVTETLSNKLCDNFYDTSNTKLSQGPVVDKFLLASKRGGRNMRGKKVDKTQDRIQTRQISKPLRGGLTNKRGRGRAKVDKKVKNLVKNNANTIPGDVYDFHEDSGDESATSSNKVETRPRLILTIKSPLSGHTNMTATSTLSITHKDVKSNEKSNKEERVEDFVQPSSSASPSIFNTRKSRRLQEKDILRSSADDIIEDVVKIVNSNTKVCKESKKRPMRQTGTKFNIQDKSTTDIRKSPRGVKRLRDRSLSDASVDSGDEKILRSEDCAIEPKVPRTQETVTTVRDDLMQSSPMRLICTAAPVTVSNPASVQVTVSASATPTVSAHVHVPMLGSSQTSTAPVIVGQTIAPIAPTPITKPPKKMISEISAKLACAFDVQQQVERAQAAPGGETRERDSVPPALVPVGATEATDARVQSPALPHRPPSAPATPAPLLPADRATPVLVRSGEGEAVVSGGGRAYRTYAGGASLPRGAHHPPAEPLAGHAAALSAGHGKQVAVVGPHPRPHHPGAQSRITITSVPSISPQGQMTMGDGIYPHFSHQHYQMYQQHFRATQHESRATPSPYTRSLEAEGCEAPTPPLELRRPPSARVPRPAHSPRQPVGEELRFNATRVVVRSPPPAHGLAPAGLAAAGLAPAGLAPVPAVPAAPAAPAAPHALHSAPTLHGRHMAHVARLAGALPPATAPGPPHASQVPREADSLQMLLRRYPVMWQGLLALKNDSAAVQMHFVGGNPNVAGDTLSRHGNTPLLRIAQRMRLEPQQLDQVHRKMKMENEHCMLLALPCGRDHMDVLQQSTNLTAGFITYLQRKQAAGIVNIAPPGHQQAMFTVHIFPSCDFANENLTRIAPDLMHRVADIAHLLIVIATV